VSQFCKKLKIRMKKILFVNLLLLSQLIAFGQFPGAMNRGPVIKGKIEGTLIDSITKEPVSFATVSLKKEGSAALLDGTVTDDLGNFRLDVTNGKYDLYFSFIGFVEKKVSVETTLKNPDYKMGQIFLSQNAVLLDAVEIAGERALIENKVDRLVFNAENDASIAGGDATDVLRKVPLLSVDLNGNVSLRGSNNVRILINGKPSGMFSSNVADALKMFPADQIKQVEVITAPSAKYDGEGSAGIINIITTKKNVEGVAGSVNTSVGNIQNNAILSLNVGKGRFGLNTNASTFYSIPVEGKSSFSRIADDLSSSYIQNGTQKTSRLGVNGSANAFYDINGFNSINSTINLRGFGFSVDGTNVADISQNGFGDRFTRTNTGSTLVGGFDWNTDYTMKFEKHEGREWSTAFQLSKDNNDQNFTVTERYNSVTALNRDLKIFNDGDNTEYTIQTDYTHPFSKSTKLELGGKAVLREIVSDFYNQNLTTGTRTNSDIFEYDQNVIAGYSSLSFIAAKKNNFIIGGRYERTDIAGKYRVGDARAFSEGYNSFLPSLTYSRTLPKFRSLKVSYTQRIQRPSLQFINPFNNNVDQFNLNTGNPQLEPELTHQTDLSYNTNFLGFTMFSSLYYKFTDGIIESVLGRDEEGRSVTQFQNIGTNRSVGLNTFISKTISKFTLRTGGNFFTYGAEGVINGQELSRNSYEYNVFANADYSFSSSIKADFFGFFKSPTRTLQGDNPRFQIYGLGIRKEWKNSSLGLRVIQPHTRSLVFASNLNANGFNQTTSFEIPFRSIGINYRYKFGKVDFRERQSKIKNSDLKAGENGGQQQGGGSGTTNGK
jgi:ferric enterobactin receptor